MNCEKCGGKPGTVDSRRTNLTVKRIRACKKCGFRWTTFELSGEIVAELAGSKPTSISVMRHINAMEAA